MTRHGFTHFFKENSIFCLAALGALASGLFVPPSWRYLDYIDWRVLGLLFSLMAVVAGFQKIGLFACLAIRLFGLLQTTRQLAAVLIFSCFFASMWITNDVSLITFVPFAMVALREAGEEGQLCKVVVLQTIAANLGSMCTPVGNPQNLYLYLVSGMGVGDFVWLLLPYTLLSFVLLALTLRLFPARPLTLPENSRAHWPLRPRLSARALCVLFGLCMLTVGGVLDYRLTLAVIAIIIFIRDREILRHVDYILLLTFVAFFIFIGNLKQIAVIYDFLTQYTAGHEFVVSLLASQIISNVPAAILLSGFTDDYAGLMLGTDIGGLGTLIASMASLISYKLYVTETGESRTFLATFTWLNAAFLCVLVIFWWLAG